MSFAQADYNRIENAYESLLKIWVGKFSSSSSDKKREGEAEMILYFLLVERTKRKELYEMAKHKFNLFTFKMDAISRKISIAFEIRKSFPGKGHEYDIDKKSRAESLEKVDAGFMEKEEDFGLKSHVHKDVNCDVVSDSSASGSDAEETLI
jgi:hypothetical protein